MGSSDLGTSNGSTVGQTYCLRWNNHRANLVEILEAISKVDYYADCTIRLENRLQFKAHRVVLAANSPYFQVKLFLNLQVVLILIK